MQLGIGPTLDIGGWEAPILELVPPTPIHPNCRCDIGNEEVPFSVAGPIGFSEVRMDLALGEDEMIGVGDLVAWDEAKQCCIKMPDGTDYNFLGFVTSYEPNAPLEDHMTVTITLKPTSMVRITGDEEERTLLSMLQALGEKLDELEEEREFGELGETVTDDLFDIEERIDGPTNP